MVLAAAVPVTVALQQAVTATPQALLHRKAIMVAAEVLLPQITAQVAAVAHLLLVAMDQVAPLVMVALGQHRQLLEVL